MKVADPLYKRYAVTLAGSYFLYACGFRICFTPLPGFFSPFPHGTGSLSVDYENLALEDGPPVFRQDFSCPALLFSSSVPHSGFCIQGFHLLWPCFPARFANRHAISGLLFRFRSPLLSESRLMSFPRSTEMFQFARFASRAFLWSARYVLRGWFPHSDIAGSMLVPKLPGAFRRPSRLSSPVIAKASTTCSYSLDPITLMSFASHLCSVLQALFEYPF